MSEERRVHLSRSAPDAYKTLDAFSKTVGRIATDAGIDPRLKELVQIHASQLNGCAFCVRVHVDRAVAAGLDADVIAQLPTWRESGVFTDRERAGLELAEAFTFIHDGGVPDEVYDHVGGSPERGRVRRAELDPRLDQRVQPRRDRGALPRPAARPRVGMSDALVPGAVNLRDVGGLPAGDRRTRSGVLFRSGNLAHLDDAGVAALGRLGLRRIIDLRADDEVPWAPSRLGDIAVTTQRAPLFLGSVDSFFANDVSLDEMYRRLVEDSADRVVDVVRGILADQPVLVHCTVGKDRTGVTVALALAAAGVDEDAVVADYARTEGLLPEARNRRVVRMLRAMHPRSVHLEDLVMRSPAPVMAALLARVSEQYGSAADYLRAHGLADDELAALRAILIDED